MKQKELRTSSESQTDKMMANEDSSDGTPVLLMIKPWLTGDDEKDAQSLRRSFRSVGFSIQDWRQLVAQAKVI